MRERGRRDRPFTWKNSTGAGRGRISAMECAIREEARGERLTGEGVKCGRREGNLVQGQQGGTTGKREGGNSERERWLDRGRGICRATSEFMNSEGCRIEELMVSGGREEFDKAGGRIPQSVRTGK